MLNRVFQRIRRRISTGQLCCYIWIIGWDDG